jgi:hypothetical protein
MFAVCLRHSAKPKKHLAKGMPSVALGEQHSLKIMSAKPTLPSAIYRALDKVFVMCYVALGKKRSRDGEKTVTETLPSATTARTQKSFKFSFLKN